MKQELKWEIGKTYRMRRGADVKKAFIESGEISTSIQQKVFDFYGYKHFTVLSTDRDGDVGETSLGDCDGLNPFIAKERHLFEEVKKGVYDEVGEKVGVITAEEMEAGINAGIENLDKGASLRRLLEAAIYTMPFHINLNCEKVQIKSLDQLEKFLTRKVKAKVRNVEESIKFFQKRIDEDEKTVIDAKNNHALLKSVL